MSGNLKIEGNSSLLDKCTVVGMKVRQGLGQIGAADIYFERVSRTASLLEAHAEFQETLGKELSCSIGDWRFVGKAESLRYESSTGRFKLVLKDPLAALDNQVESIVFAAEGQMISHIIKNRIPECKFIGKDKSIGLAIQYQESTLKFVKRMLSRFGYQIWCDAGVIYAGAGPSSEESRVLKMGREILDFTLTTQLGPEGVEVKAFEYDSIDGGISEKPELGGNGQGDVQKGMINIRRNNMSTPRLHAVGEDLAVSIKEAGTEFLRLRADGRIKLTGRISIPVALGGAVKVASADSSESCMIKKLSGSVDSSGRGSWEMEAVSSEALLEAYDTEAPKLLMSIAVVDKAKNTWDRDRVCASDSMNRVCVSFPWDPNGSRPFLRLLSPSWGDGHMHYTRPEVGDAVIVVWGQPDFDPVVVGAINAGTGSSKNRRKIDDPDVSMLLRMAQGLTITTDKKSIVLHNEANKGDSRVEIEPDAFTAKTKTGGIINVDKDSIRLEDGKGTVIELKSGQINLTAKKINLTTPSLNVK